MIGCLECDCNPTGVVNGNMQCDLERGQCGCKPNIVGRTCDKCVSYSLEPTYKQSLEAKSDF